MSVTTIGSAEQTVQRILDDYVLRQGAVAATLLVTFPDGSQVRLGGGDSTLSADSLEKLLASAR
jgi:hypothetical protein